MRRCTTGKVRYSDRIAAMLAIVDQQDKDERKGERPIRCYHCTTCRGWHITSMPLANDEAAT